ncbi:MAG: MFS transporter [Actinomycetales bacterium]
MSTSAPSSASTTPARAPLVLGTLILAALVCNVNLSVANIALSDIGLAFDAAQTQLNLVAIGCSLGLAMSVLYLGAIGDRYGRKLLLILGLVLTLPFSALAAWAPSVDVLIAARILTGVAAGMAFPTTLALITALWSAGPQRLRAITLWSGVSGGAAILGPVIAGGLLEVAWWGSVFLIAVVPAVIAIPLVVWVVPAHVNESTERVDHLGGVLSVVMIALLVIGLGLISAPGLMPVSVVLMALAAVLVVAFFIQQRHAQPPLYDLHYAGRRLFWVAAVAGMIVFGSLMGAMFVGQQFLQNVLNYSTLMAGLAVLPAAFGMMLAAPVSARLVQSYASRVTMLIGYTSILLGFLIMLISWRATTAYVWVGAAYLLVGVGAGIALTPASRLLTSSVPVSRVGMASGTSDLQRDLGGAILQALLGSLLTAGYAAKMLSQISSAPDASNVTASTQAALQMSYASAANVSKSFPQYAEQIVQAAQQSFLEGANWAYAAAAFAVIIGGLLVLLRLPGAKAEAALLADYARADNAAR